MVYNSRSIKQNKDGAKRKKKLLMRFAARSMKELNLTRMSKVRLLLILGIATTAAAKAEESLASKIFSGIWEGIKKVAVGLAIFVAVVVVVAAIIALATISGPITLAAFAAAFVAALGTAVLVVGIGFLLYGFITAMVKRSDDFWKTYGTNIPWYQKAFGFLAVLGLSIGDTVGITPIIEGIIGKEAFTGKEFTPEQQAEKITEGVLTIALMFILGRVLKGAKPGEVRPGEVKPVKLNQVKLNQVKLNQGKLNQVKLNQVKLNQVKLNQVKLNQVKLNQVKLNQVKLNQVKLNQVKLNQVKLNQVKLNQVKLNQVR
jgi:hypothetical protein